MEAKDITIMVILKDAFGDKIPVGAFQTATEAYTAGKTDGYKEGVESMQGTYKAGRESMLKEVIEWVETNGTDLSLISTSCIGIAISSREWQAFKEGKKINKEEDEIIAMQAEQDKAEYEQHDE